ncbi:hypothetical protein [Synechococcus sp. CBW1108]|uniref:hypothetical protein n=1 Tax=Synechococcus sp. CBW1108 TaxID=1353147 RepID=UPI0018CCC41A|nr:hypothetical protein [Synechococcus sp. CBW1108]QPN70749.1 hypothetical protein H8F27_03650 [Synechococcus sp. CBW1108]
MAFSFMPLLVFVIAVILIGLPVAGTLIHAKNVRAAKSILPSLRQTFVGLHGIQQTDQVRCIRIDEIGISEFPQGTDVGTDFLTLFCSVIEPDLGQSNELVNFTTATGGVLGGRFSFRIEPGRWHLIDLSFLSFPPIRRWPSIPLFNASLDRLCRQGSVSFFGQGSLDAEVCSLMFLNLPEAQWACKAAAELEATLEPITATYYASLSNELLSGNSKQLLKMINVLQAEHESLCAYAREAQDAMRKAHEYLSVPSMLKDLGAINIDSLRVYSRRKHIRDAFNSSVATKAEYDELRSSAL